MNHQSGLADRSLLDLSVRDFLDLLASSAPAPGGGAAAALAGALGAALVEMTANLTVGRPRFVEVEDQARRILERASTARRELQAKVDADAEAFRGVSSAYKLPRGTDEERAARSRAIQAALAEAAEVPLEVVRLSARLLDVCEDAAPVLNSAVISDVGVGAILAQSAVLAAVVNVDVNVNAMTDPAASEQLSAALAVEREGSDEAAQRAVEKARARMPRPRQA